MEKETRVRSTYSSEFKYQAVKMYKKGQIGYKAIAKLLGIPSHTMVQLWVRNFDKYGMVGLEERRGKAKSPHKGRPKTKFATVEEEVKALRAEVALLKKMRALQKGDEKENKSK
ncbi:helix-turn-helix protein [Tumebacillus sp. BK434]|uniref:helix-turn-helix domain-containing protein n=1 Tax=Tumebacillus sp. BK434 TaxID=2512169 RepID=UPI00104503E4|nr:helix-turn-helix domain-containing protein [Tumebacillus sp. BK434]TCP57998.1 helix-turn-helix protein [Tumebacillus sp. BK434]